MCWIAASVWFETLCLLGWPVSKVVSFYFLPTCLALAFAEDAWWLFVLFSQGLSVFSGRPKWTEFLIVWMVRRVIWNWSWKILWHVCLSLKLVISKIHILLFALSVWDVGVEIKLWFHLVYGYQIYDFVHIVCWIAGWFERLLIPIRSYIDLGWFVSLVFVNAYLILDGLIIY